MKNEKNDKKITYKELRQAIIEVMIECGCLENPNKIVTPREIVEGLERKGITVEGGKEKAIETWERILREWRPSYIG
ncbi:MAG: hypothetical protein ACE5K4_10710 [Candidatus Hydrothermarchaeota archaeon]